MKHVSTYSLVTLLLFISSLVVWGLNSGCEQNKEFQAPWVGQASGDTTTGGGKTKKISLFVTPSKEAVQPIDSSQYPTFLLGAFVENGSGQPMPDGTLVLWAASIGSLSATSSTTTSGETSVTLTFPEAYDGCSWVTASSGNAQDKTKVCANLLAPTPTQTATPTVNEVLIVIAKETVISPDGETIITATVLTDGQADIGIQVSFEIIQGSDYATLSASAAKTNYNGKASVKLYGRNENEHSQMLKITATTNDGRSGEVQVLIEGVPPTPTPTPTPTSAPTSAPTSVPTIP